MKYEDLLGKKFEYGGRGPDVYDCWGLLMELYRRRGIVIPDYESPTDWKEIAAMIGQEIVAWTECKEEPGATVLMRMASEPHHVGMYLGMGRFIHIHQNRNGGVCVDRVNDWKNRIVGYYRYSNP